MGQQVLVETEFAPFAKGEIPHLFDPSFPTMFFSFSLVLLNNDLRQARRDLMQSCRFEEACDNSVCLNLTPLADAQQDDREKAKVTLESCDCEGQATCFCSMHSRCASFYPGISYGHSGPFPVNKSRSCKMLSMSL